ncbi:unnamed protein product [Nippostrongylus brasiliensis]|uniref:Secreted protein n=1 Tax=Nippostrongylus brasiliensis TaxID=27835 RepID=A0A158R227_NIPBR|nr:unnamed protein product [Nippostrongylus brasiliensis]
MLVAATLLFAYSLAGRISSTTADCDLIEEATTLQCVSPLVEYVNADRYMLHPPLSDIDELCHRFKEYKRCTTGIQSSCRKSRAPNVERMYEGMCEESFLRLVREELLCLSQLESWESLPKNMGM